MPSLTDFVPPVPDSGNFGTFLPKTYHPVGHDTMDMLLFPQFIAEGATTASLQMQTLMQNMNPTDPAQLLKAQGLMAVVTTTMTLAANCSNAVHQCLKNIADHIS